MNFRPILRFASLGLPSLLLIVPIRAADEPAVDKTHATEASALAGQAVATYRFSMGKDEGRLEPQPGPVLTFTNPILGEVYGDVYLWTFKGRPEVVASFVKWYHPYTHRTHEFESLSLGPIGGERSGQSIWSSGRPGVELAPVPDAPEPATTPALRLRQMRDLTRRFTGRQTDSTGVDRDIRLLAKPLYRYEKTEGDLLDGALFVFALGTDPDAFLLIEDRIADGKPRWHYGLTRMTSLPMIVSYQDRQVWNVPKLEQSETYSHRGTYTCFSYAQ